MQLTHRLNDCHYYSYNQFNIQRRIKSIYNLYIKCLYILMIHCEHVSIEISENKGSIGFAHIA